ncbi:fec operon regulator FecR [Gammaproteobacteria bacterium MOLA455]|nr:fec operon regulator FecR [Gammaproteobacteria bacterium MOLA455]
MNNIRPLPDNQKLYDEASQWIVKMDKGLSADEQIALREWLHADQQCHDIFMEMTRLWDKMDAMSRLSDLFAKPGQVNKPIHAKLFSTKLFNTKLSNTKTLWQNYRAIAASLVLASLIGLSLILGIFNADTGNQLYQTAIGEQSTATLADGTQITLNTNTSVEVHYTDHARLLHLDSGELHVSVAKDPTRPLSVIVGDQIVQAIGTEFNIEITDKQKIELVVTEGKVKVGVQSAAEKSHSNEQPLTLPFNALAVSAGEEVMLGDSSQKVTEVSPEDIAVRLSWRNGNLIFRGESLEEAVKEINRYTSVEFVFMSEDLKKMRVAGLFKAGDVEGLLATLRENFDIVSQRDGDGKVLLSTDK